MTLTEQFKLVTQHYQRWDGEIIERSALKRPMWHDPYMSELDIMKCMSPIEKDTWNSIRENYGLPLYPQYPVGKYFTDFGNPFFKVAIECDGKMFHQDKEKDKKRDEYFKQLGWLVYRVTGSDCARIINTEFEYEEEMSTEQRERLMEIYDVTVDGLIKALAIKYCKLRVDWFEYALSYECLAKHLTNGTEPKIEYNQFYNEE